MQEEIQKIMPEAISKQKEAVIADLARLSLWLEFREMIAEKEKPTNKKDLEQWSMNKLKSITPIKDDVEAKKAYYEFLCAKE